MWWLTYALLAHVMNAAVFVVDKSILVTDSKISSPVKYAAWSGLAATGAGGLLALSYTVPTATVMGWSLLAGVCWVTALWLFFVALQAGEPSVVVPLTGSVVPIFTWLAAIVLLGERLDGLTMVAVVMLVLGGTVLSLRLSAAAGTRSLVMGAAVLSGGLFAAYFATVKHIYVIFPFFIAGFAYSRIGVGVVALILLSLMVMARAGKQPERQVGEKGKNKLTGIIVGAFLASKGLGMTALLLQNYAISLGSVTVVNALQGTQYLFLLILAWLVSQRYPKLWREEFTRVTLAQKVGGISLVSAGLLLLVI